MSRARQLPSSSQSSETCRPSHYSRYDPEPITVIERWSFGFHLGNVVKYLARAQHKGTELRDLRKAAWYLARYIQVRESQLQGLQAPAPAEQA